MGKRQRGSEEEMKYVKARPEEAEIVFEIVQNTVKTVYPKYYPGEVVDFFCELHRKERIAEEIENAGKAFDGYVGILVEKDKIVGTGSYAGNHITRVYVLPEHQGKGYGGYIMQCLEAEIFAKHDAALLDASLPASGFYEKRGYRTIRHERYPVENGAVLVYEVMEKKLAEQGEAEVSRAGRQSVGEF